MTGLAPALIVTADRDRLRSSAEAFAGDLARGGVDVNLVRQRGALHGYLNEIGHPAAESTIALIAREVAAAGAA